MSLFSKKKIIRVTFLFVICFLVALSWALYLPRTSDPLIKEGWSKVGHLISGSYSLRAGSFQDNASPELSSFVKDQLKDLPFVVDSHMHLVSMQNQNFIHSKFLQPYKHPFYYLKAKAFMSALGVRGLSKADLDITKRLEGLIQRFPFKSYYGFIFAFAATYERETGKKILELTGFEVANSSMLEFVKDKPHLIPVGSVHPFQKNMKEEFTLLSQARVGFVKILPNSMHFAPNDPACLAFFEHLVKHKMVLIAHVGDEKAVDVGGVQDEYGNPLLYEPWLKKFPSLKIIFAHVGSEGVSSDHGGKEVANFDLVLRMMEQFPQQTFADISAFSSVPARVSYLPNLLTRKDLFPRLIYGSDYPIPCFLPLIKVNLLFLQYYGLLSHIDDIVQFKENILQVYQYNPLLSSLLLMKNISYEGNKLPLEVFYKNIFALLNEEKMSTHPLLLKPGA